MWTLWPVPSYKSLFFLEGFSLILVVLNLKTRLGRRVLHLPVPSTKTRLLLVPTRLASPQLVLSLPPTDLQVKVHKSLPRKAPRIQDQTPLLMLLLLQLVRAMRALFIQVPLRIIRRCLALATLVELPRLCTVAQLHQRLVPVLDQVALRGVKMPLVHIQLVLLLLKPALVLLGLSCLMLVLVLKATLFPAPSDTQPRGSLQSLWM